MRIKQEIWRYRNKLEKFYLLNEIKKITDEELRKQSKIKKKLHETNEHLKSSIIHKNKEKQLEKQANLNEEKHTMKNQIQHFEAAEKRYKDIFVAINQKEKKIQESYQKLQPGCKNLALAEVEKDKSLELLLSRQNQRIKEGISDQDRRATLQKVRFLLIKIYQNSLYFIKGNIIIILESLSYY